MKSSTNNEVYFLMFFLFSLPELCTSGFFCFSLKIKMKERFCLFLYCDLWLFDYANENKNVSGSFIKSFLFIYMHTALLEIFDASFMGDKNS